MGVIISLIIAECALITSGVLASVSAAKESQYYAIGSAAVSFVAFIVTLVITILLL